ncbi:hypothetical protein O3S81_20250 [Agrobacterium sp. SOY23]|uniref:hypothetical protein n=1 Tax=Agrobacterium sp. SOY23 TaxID=3014555 RepID=UPI0022B07F03|nr:hypothetical protein [Agrobacterium sp. SOY23]MCZ4432045.1 hypothetical protein [Agrobacterium sp. SOY23]
MGQQLSKWKRRKEARQRLYDIGEDRAHTLVIHYSCESFYEIKDGRTPRVTSIAVRYFASGTTASFSIHKSAELSKIAFGDIDGQYDVLEKQMLDEFFKFIEIHQQYQFVHWNMRDINYGFQAIEHRYKVLGGNPISIQESKKTDVARLLIDVYGPGYAAHGKSGRLHTLMDLNSIKTKDVLTGKEEAQAFDDKEYVKLHQSTLKKVDVVDNLLDRFIDGNLKTQAKFKEKYGYHPAILFELLSEHWIVSLLGVAIAMISFIAVFFPDLFPSIFG